MSFSYGTCGRFLSPAGTYRVRSTLEAFMRTPRQIAIPALTVLAMTISLAARAKERGESSVVARGRYLVTIGGCNDCHTPMKMGPSGPAPDQARLLSGHPQGIEMPPAPTPTAPWASTVAATRTAWAGPWGVSYTANLTPDPETGLGKWSEQNFIEAMRTGRHMGRGRPILPPMPYFNYGSMTDADLKALFAYLRSIPPLKNRVPEPIVAAPRGGTTPTQGRTNDASPVSR